MPVLVKGPISCQDFIAASLSSPAVGQRANSSESPETQRVVALALENKATEDIGRVQAFVLFGLGSIAMLGRQSTAAVAAQLHELKQVFLQTEHDLKVHVKLRA